MAGPQPTPADLFAYISDFYKTVDAKLNYLTQSVTTLKNHMTRLYAMAVDCTALPPATGHLKLKQDACLALLRQVDAVLRENGIPYFLGYGNLLGAARTGGFIPWDDDVDICLMRDDFERAIPILTEKFNHDEYFTSWGISGGIFKVLFTSKVCVDLFPWDYYYTRMETPDQVSAFTDDYMTAMETARQMEADKRTLDENPNAIVQSKYTSYREILDDIVLHHNPQDPVNGDIIEGIDWQTYPERLVQFFHCKPFRREWVFPLGEIEFCGHKFMAPNNVDAWLTTRFGDWHEFKPDFTHHRNSSFGYEELAAIHNLINNPEIK